MAGLSAPPPLLSICVPTHNHADLLETGLAHLVATCRPYAGQVEIVVADNASTDRTPEVAARWRDEPNFRYFRRDRNITGNGNILQTPREFARGEFAWVIGDDDLILPGALPVLLGLLAAHPGVDYFVGNYSHDSLERREALIRERPAAYTPPADTLICPDTTVGRHESLASVFELARGDFRFLTHITGQITRTFRWREVRLASENFSMAGLFCTLENTFPHLMLLMQGAKNRPVVYCGQPLALATIGAQETGAAEWAHARWLDCLYRCHELRARWRAQGVNRRILRLMRRRWIGQWTHDLGLIWFQPTCVRPRPGLIVKSVFRSVPEPGLLLRRFLPLLAKKGYVAAPEWFRRLYRRLRGRTAAAAQPPG